MSPIFHLTEDSQSAAFRRGDGGACMTRFLKNNFPERCGRGREGTHGARQRGLCVPCVLSRREISTGGGFTRDGGAAYNGGDTAGRSGGLQTAGQANPCGRLFPRPFRPALPARVRPAKSREGQAMRFLYVHCISAVLLVLRGMWRRAKTPANLPQRMIQKPSSQPVSPHSRLRRPRQG